MRLLITGASGMLGSTAAKELEKKYTVYATGNSEIASHQFENYKLFDLSVEDYSPLLDWAKPDLIIHAAALTNGNFCKENPDKAININGLTLDKFLKQSMEHVKIIYISTDAVFSNSCSLSIEEDCLNPENIYGKSKEIGEFFLKNSNRDYCILRTTIVGLNILGLKKSFVEWILYSVENNIEIGLFNDVLFNPISIWDFVKELEENIIPNNINGVYHLTGSEVCTKYEFGKRLVQEMNLSDNSIHKNSIVNFSDRAKRCADQTLSVKKYEKEFCRKLPDISQTINSIKQNYNEKFKIRK